MTLRLVEVLLCQVSFLLSVTYFECYIQALYAEYCYAECRYAVCRYSECRSAVFFWVVFTNMRGRPETSS
jgi:hypothetical protein